MVNWREKGCTGYRNTGTIEHGFFFHIRNFKENAWVTVSVALRHKVMINPKSRHATIYVPVPPYNG